MAHGRSEDVRTGTLAAATPANVTFDMDVTGRTFGAIVRNTGGANAIGTTTVAVSNDNSNFVTDSSIVVPSIAAGGAASIGLVDVEFRYVRITMTSAGGSTYSIESNVTG